MYKVLVLFIGIVMFKLYIKFIVLFFLLLRGKMIDRGNLGRVDLF